MGEAFLDSQGQGAHGPGPRLPGHRGHIPWGPIPISEASFRANPTAKQGKPQAFFGGDLKSSLILRKKNPTKPSRHSFALSGFTPLWPNAPLSLAMNSDDSSILSGSRRWEDCSWMMELSE